ncbi:MAG: NifU family protein [Mycoplasmataceae bacterium]|jgi:Fe-S cluster biogenesis protein NfuA|nr:NifU family protein [Mycoplasmataceae bacterium]
MENEAIVTKIKNLISELKYYIQNDGGDMEFVSFIDGILTIKISGACVGCDYAYNTFDEGIKLSLLTEIKEIKDVVFTS